MLHNNPWDGNGFNVQICCLIIAPAFFAGAVYLTLKYFVIVVGREYSRIQPKYYTWVFCLCDLFSLVLQGSGGGIAATADTQNMQDVGNNLMMAGIVWQVFTLLVFGVIVADYVYRAWCQRNSWSQDTVNLVNSLQFKLFSAAMFLAFLTIFTRCVYRIAEMANGWANSIMQDEAGFIVLDGVYVLPLLLPRSTSDDGGFSHYPCVRESHVLTGPIRMCLIAVLCLTIFHPGYFFKPMMTYKLDKKATKQSRKTMADVESPSPRS